MPISRFFMFLCCFVLFTATGTAQDSLHIFGFGNSLIDHRPPLNPTPSDETTIAHWLRLLALADGNELAMGGQYGFLPQHQQVPPISQWGYDIVPGVWESDTETFAETDINFILLTSANFIQYQGPEQPYFNEPTITPLSATRTVFDWTASQRPGAYHYLYLGWPDMAPFLNAGFPPAPNEWAAYQDYTLGDYHDWWLVYQDSMRDARPNLNPKLIPVAPVFTRIQQGILQDSLAASEWFEDDAPHGTPNLYFIAALTTYMALTQNDAPENFTFPNTLHPAIAHNYEQINLEIIDYFEGFNYIGGESRVYRDPNVSTTVGLDEGARIQVYPNPAKDHLHVSVPADLSTNSTELLRVKIYNGMGQLVLNKPLPSNKLQLSVAQLAAGMYVVEIGTHRKRLIVR